MATEAAVAEAVVAEEVNGGGARKRRLAVAEVVVDREAVSRKSPAIGNRLLWHSGRDKAGRCGDFDRTCHNIRP